METFLVWGVSVTANREWRAGPRTREVKYGSFFASELKWKRKPGAL